jgi:hypothetical protein
MGNRISVQSFCFRGTKDNAVVAAKVKQCGLAAIELCGVHVDFAAAATFAGAVRTYRDAGVAVVSAGVNGISGDPAKDRPLFEFVKAAGASVMSVDFGLDGLDARLACAWALDAGEDPVKMIEEFGPRLALVHLKDFVFDRARKPEDVVVGTGNLSLPKVATALASSGFAGELVLEYEGDVANPVPALAACVQAIRREMDIAP